MTEECDELPILTQIDDGITHFEVCLCVSAHLRISCVVLHMIVVPHVIVVPHILYCVVRHVVFVPHILYCGVPHVVIVPHMVVLRCSSRDRCTSHGRTALYLT